MTNEEKQQITGYLSGPRDYYEGVSLYQKFGSNLRLKQVFVTDDSLNTREILFEELRKLSGLSDDEFRKLPRRAFSKSKAATPQAPAVSETPEESESEYAEAPEPVRRMIRFREQYPFLNEPDCPDVLKVLVSDMFTSYYRYKEAHARLQEYPDEETAATAAECETLIAEYLNNREIRAELDYYKENGCLLGKAAKLREGEPEEDFSDLTDIDLVKKMNSANVQISKHRKTVNEALEAGSPNEKAESELTRWTERVRLIREEIERRKKK